MVFEGELAFHGVERGLDLSADFAEFPQAFLLVFAIRTDLVGFELLAEERLEFLSGGIGSFHGLTGLAGWHGLDQSAS